jgi:AcrR family transcriptional regulator
VNERAHTGRARNEAARRAILDATVALLPEADVADVTVDAIAAAAAVGKQTIYRWWPSKGALLLEAMRDRARVDVPAPDEGSLVADLEVFLVETFRRARRPSTAAVLRASMRESQSDAATLEALRLFTADRRRVLGEVIDRGRRRGEVSATCSDALLIDQAFGFLWYRLLLQHAPLVTADARALARGLASQAGARGASYT